MLSVQLFYNLSDVLHFTFFPEEGKSSIEHNVLSCGVESPLFTKTLLRAPASGLGSLLHCYRPVIVPSWSVYLLLSCMFLASVSFLCITSLIALFVRSHTYSKSSMCVTVFSGIGPSPNPVSKQPLSVAHLLQT